MLKISLAVQIYSRIDCANCVSIYVNTSVLAERLPTSPEETVAICLDWEFSRTCEGGGVMLGGMVPYLIGS